MQKGKISYFQLGIILICLFLPLTFKISSSVEETGKIAKYCSKMIPMGAIFYELNSSYITHRFTMNDFYPENPHIRRYKIHVDALIWIDSHSSTTDVSVRNLWNACEPEVTVNHESGFHQTISYVYSRPTASDPDFVISLRLVDIRGKTNGWVYMMFVNDGETAIPPDFIMPASTCSGVDTSTITETTNADTTITRTTSAKSSGIKQITFPFLFSLAGCLTYFIYKFRMRQ